MAMMSAGNLGQYIGGQLGLQQQQQALANQWVRQDAVCTNAASTAAITINPILASPKRNRVESAVEWLDRRVNEMRVAL